MADRICALCKGEMEPIKNGFIFVTPDCEVYVSDLWGCKKCRRFQIHRSPKEKMLTVHGILHHGNLEADQGELSEVFRMVKHPSLTFSQLFHDHMEEWYPEWEWEGR